MAKLDFEASCALVLAAVRANLNAKITAINTEKDDDVTVAQIDAAAFFYQRVGQALPNYLPFVHFAVESKHLESVGPQSSERVTMTFEIVTSDQGLAGSDRVFNLLARYRRALREVLSDRWSALGGAKLTELDAMAFDTGEQNLWSVASQISFTIAS